MVNTSSIELLKSAYLDPQQQLKGSRRDCRIADLADQGLIEKELVMRSRSGSLTLWRLTEKGRYVSQVMLDIDDIVKHATTTPYIILPLDL